MRINKRGGLTLVEVVVAIGLFAVIMVTLYPAFLLTTKIDLTSKQFTDASVLAQNEMEYVYNDFLTNNTTTVVSHLGSVKGYACTGSWTCTKTVGGYTYNLTVTVNTPISKITRLLLTVMSTTGENPGDRAQITYFAREVTP